MINLAILSPNQFAYSETFIQAHRLLPFNIKFYYGGLLPSCLDGEGSLIKNSLTKFYYHAKSKLTKKLSASELAFKDSLKKNDIHIVLAEFGMTAAESLNVVRRLEIPLIVHFHGLDASEKSILANYNNCYKEVFSYASAIIVVSKKMRLALIQLGCPEEKLLLNIYGPNPQFFNIYPNFNKKQFVAIGRFVDKKAPYLLIQAFKKVVKKHPDATLMMAGDGPLLNTCVNLVKTWGIENNVFFKGILKPEEVKNLLSTSLAFVQHSIVALNGDSEGTPVSILEAQAAGLPVISTIHAGIAEVVIHGETGLLSEELDIESMTKNMLYLIENPGKVKDWSRQAKINIETNFTLERHLKVIEELIKNVV